MFQEKDIYHEMLGSLMIMMSGKGRGDTISHVAIENAAGISRYSTHWNHLIKKFKRRVLKEFGLMMWSVTDVGYRICTRDEQLNDNPERRMREMRRRSTRAIIETRALPEHELTPGERRIKHYRIAAIKAQRKAIGRSMRDQRSHATQTLPQRKLPAETLEAVST